MPFPSDENDNYERKYSSKYESVSSSKYEQNTVNIQMITVFTKDREMDISKVFTP